MNGIRRFVFFILTIFLQIQSACSLCNMPTAWHGLWYQRGMNSLLEITIDHIQTKGRCQDVLPVQQYYLFNDQINRCTRCLLFIDRHPNLLQYRESECNDADELSSVTLCPNLIAPDAPLYTLYRNNSKSELCPIQPPFLLTNFLKDGLKCPHLSSPSYIGECANDHQFRLHLSSCPSFYRTLDLQLVCIGTWIEGFNTYFVTRILSEHHQHRYACFYYVTKQKDFSPTFSLSMTTDDSCLSLNSKQMATVMTLTSKNQQIHNRKNHSCTFPNDLQQFQWYSLNHTIEMFITNENIEFIHQQDNDKYQRFNCLQAIDSTNYRIRTFTNCDVKDQCLKIIQRTANVLELILHNCYDNETSKSLIFLTHIKSISSCPISIGHFLLESILDHHHHSIVLRNKLIQLSVGCEKKEKVMIYQIEKDDRSLTQTDTCLASWQSSDISTIYVIAQSIYSNASYCLIFQMSASILIRNNSHECSIKTNSENSQSIHIYSAKLLNPCSQSQRVLFNTCFFLFVFLIYI